MNDIITSINNRELALLLWIAVLSLFLVFKNIGLNAISNLLKMIFWSKLTIVFLMILTYTVLTAYFLSIIDLWNISQFKNTAVWFFTVGAVSLSSITDRDKSNYLQETIKDILGFTAILQFFISIYSFSLLTEILLVPVLFLLGSMRVVAETQKEYHPLASVLRKFIMFTGVLLIAFTLFKVVTDFKSFAGKGTLTDFLIPALLSFLFLPMLYVISIWITQQDLFISLGKKIKSRKLLRYAKWKTLMHFHANKTDLYRWQKLVFLQKIASKNDVDKSIECIKIMKRREKNPPQIETAKGWSPYAALKFLWSKNITAGYYQPTHIETKWMACSKYMNVDDNIPPSHLSYYVEGNAEVATRVSLYLTVFNSKFDGLAIAEFVDSVEVLCKNALKSDVSNLAFNKIMAGSDWKIELDNKNLILKKSYLHNKDRGYNMTFCIETLM